MDEKISARMKLERATEHIEALRGELKSFTKSAVASFGCRMNERAIAEYFIKNISDPPRRIGVIAADAINNLVSALDHLTYQLIRKDSSDLSASELRSISFPFSRDADSFKERISKLKGASDKTREALKVLQPYCGGTGESLWQLNALNNIEKHRTLLVVTMCANGLDPTRDGLVEAARKIGVSPDVAEKHAAALPFQIRLHMRPVIAKPGAVVFTDYLPRKCGEARVTIFFGVGWVEQDVSAEPLVLEETLTKFRDAVDKALTSLEALLQ